MMPFVSRVDSSDDVEIGNGEDLSLMERLDRVKESFLRDEEEEESSSSLLLERFDKIKESFVRDDEETMPAATQNDMNREDTDEDNVVLTLTVDLGGCSDTLNVRDGDAPRDLALEFCKKNGLADGVVDVLSDYIASQMAEQLDEEEEEDGEQEKEEEDVQPSRYSPPTTQQFDLKEIRNDVNRISDTILPSTTSTRTKKTSVYERLYKPPQDHSTTQSTENTKRNKENINMAFNGHRLYENAKRVREKRKHQIEKRERERLEEEMRECRFAPKINKKKGYCPPRPVFDRLSSQDNFTGVYGKRFRSGDGRLNAESDLAVSGLSRKTAPTIITSEQAELWQQEALGLRQPLETSLEPLKEHDDDDGVYESLYLDAKRRHKKKFEEAERIRKKNTKKKNSISQSKAVVDRLEQAHRKAQNRLNAVRSLSETIDIRTGQRWFNPKINTPPQPSKNDDEKENVHERLLERGQKLQDLKRKMRERAERSRKSKTQRRTSTRNKKLSQQFERRVLGQIYDEIFPNETERERILKRLPRMISNVLCSTTVSDLSCSRFTSLVIGNTKAAELHGVLNQWISKRQRSLLLSSSCQQFRPEINLRSRDLNRPDPVHMILHSKGEEYVVVFEL